MLSTRTLTLFLLLAGCDQAPQGDLPDAGAMDAATDARVADTSIDTSIDNSEDPSFLDAEVADARVVDTGTDVSDEDTSIAVIDAGPLRLGAEAWIRREFADASALSGERRSRTRVEAPALVHDATGCCSKYAFEVRDEAEPFDTRVGFVNVRIEDLVSPDAYGAGIATRRDTPGAILYLANVQITPRWPRWAGYSTTNYDGMVLDGSEAIYAEDLSIDEWNADTAMDIKAQTAQFVRLQVAGPGHRTLRFWRPGPHYIVESQLDNTGEYGTGALLWFNDCSEVEVRIYASTFEGMAEVPEDRIDCGSGSSPNLVYLDTDPRTTGEMHEMFSY